MPQPTVNKPDSIPDIRNTFPPAHFHPTGRYRLVIDRHGTVHIHVSDHDTSGHLLAATLAGNVRVHYTPSLLGGLKL